jgi:hypothetical protein
MNTVAIVKVLWISSIFATSALVSQALVESGNGGPVVDVPPPSGPSDAGTPLPRGLALGTGDMAVAWCSWDAAL